MLLLLLLLCRNADVVISRDNNNAGQEIEYLHVNSQIWSRFAVTVFTSRIRNVDQKPTELHFHAIIPEEAFITNFSMLIKDNIIFGDVQEKQRARAMYTTALQKGHSAGLVFEKSRETNSFQISVNVGAGESVTFNLTYQEILRRVHLVYKHVINVQSDQPVKDLKIRTVINEMALIRNLKVVKFDPKIGEKTNLELLSEMDEPKAKISITGFTGYRNSGQAIVTFDGTETTARHETVGQLVILYDVARDNSGGSVQVLDGHFIHFFSPTGLKKGKKEIIFVLDKSGSMQGRKFDQLQAAMKRVILDLDQEDKFNIILFDHVIQMWKMEPMKATEENKLEAIQYVYYQWSQGWTNIFDALKKALELLLSSPSSAFYTPMIFFLTDGQATSGVQNNDVIIQNITAINGALAKPCILHSLAFGMDADYKLVQQLSENNWGIAKIIFEDSDADLQLTGFYAEISTPLLSNVTFEYLNGSVDVSTLAESGKYNYYHGGELVVIGKLANGNNPPVSTISPAPGEPIVANPLFDVKVTALAAAVDQHRDGSVHELPQLVFHASPMICCFGPKCAWPPGPHRQTISVEQPLHGSTTLRGFIERMWAHLTVKKLLKDFYLKPYGNEFKEAEALKLALKFKFVTSLTSMVIVQPDTNLTEFLLSENDRKETLFIDDEIRHADIQHNKVALFIDDHLQHAHIPHKEAALGLRLHGIHDWNGSAEVHAETDITTRRTTTARSTAAQSSYHDKPLVAYLDVTGGINDETTRKNLDFLEMVRNCTIEKGRHVYVSLQSIILAPQMIVKLTDSLPIGDKSRISNFKHQEESALFKDAQKQTILDNMKQDGKHVAVVLTRKYPGIPGAVQVQINTAFENFVIEKMQQQTFLFLACFGCQINSDGFRGSAARLRIFTNAGLFNDVCETVLRI